MNIEERVFSYIEKYSMIEAGSQVIVGISGGADSVCLLFLLKKYQERKDFQLYGVHVNHGIRGQEAYRDQEFSENLCRKLEIPFTVYSYDVPEIAVREKLSEEEAGRNVRRQAFMQKALELKDAGQINIALAHHENDNAETVLHHLIRGTRAGGLGGIRPVQEGEGGAVYIRPLLTISRGDIEGYLTEQNLVWMTDSTNRELLYTRNKIRHRVLPELESINPRAVSHIAQAAAAFREIQEYLWEQAELLCGRYVTREEEEYRIRKELFQEKELMQSYVVMMVLERAAGKRKDIGSAHIEAVLALGKGRTGASVSLMGGLTASQVYGDVHIRQGEAAHAPLLEMEFLVFPWENQQIPEKTYTKWFDYDKIKSSLEVRHRQQGDYLSVTEEGGRKKLKDYFIDCKIPRKERETLTLLAEGSHILWVVGHRISQYYKITNETKRVLKVHIKGVEEDE